LCCKPKPPPFKEREAKPDYPLIPGTQIRFKSLGGGYLRHSDFKIFNHPSDNSQIFALDSLFTVTAPLSGNEGAVSFRSVNYPSRFIRHI